MGGKEENRAFGDGRFPEKRVKVVRKCVRAYRNTDKRTTHNLTHHRQN
jgi:hypothetical protein